MRRNIEPHFGECALGKGDGFVNYNESACLRAISKLRFRKILFLYGIVISLAGCTTLSGPIGCELGVCNPTQNYQWQAGKNCLAHAEAARSVLNQEIGTPYGPPARITALSNVTVPALAKDGSIIAPFNSCNATFLLDGRGPIFGSFIWRNNSKNQSIVLFLDEPIVDNSQAEKAWDRADGENEIAKYGKAHVEKYQSAKSAWIRCMMDFESQHADSRLLVNGVPVEDNSTIGQLNKQIGLEQMNREVQVCGMGPPDISSHTYD